MSYLHLAYLHLGTVVPALVIGTILIKLRKGTPVHRVLGRTYMVLMLTTAATVLLMPAQFGPQLMGHFGLIHLFSVLTFYSVIQAWRAIKVGDVQTHRANMIGLYFYGLLIAGSFALLPGRMLNGWLFG